MNRGLLIVALILLGSSLGMAAMGLFADSPGLAEAGHDGTPAIDPNEMIASPEEFDFGTLNQNEEVKAEFTLRNPSAEPMTIQFVTRSCACSEPQLDAKELAPGASTTMRILFKTQMRSGEAVIPLSVRYVVGTDVQPREKRIALKARIRPDIEQSAPAFVFDEKKKTVSITLSAGAKPLPKIVKVTSSTTAVTAVLSGTTVIAQCNDSKASLDREYILIETTDPSENWLRIPVRRRSSAAQSSGF